MKKEKSALLKKAYSKYVDLILNDFPIEKIDELVVENLKGFGSTVDEKFQDISRFRRMILDQREQEAGIEIKWQQTPVHSRISPEEDTVIFTDEFTLTMQMEGDIHVIPLRLSSIFEFNNASWKLVHIHGSVGVETEENDTWHKEEWKQKQAELEKQVKEKTTELVHKNRELEIEASLERVRAVAMGMNKPGDMIDVCRIISEQLQILEVDHIRNVQTAIINDDKGTYLNYEFFTQYNTTSILEIKSDLHPKVMEFVNSIKKSKDAFFTTNFEGQALKDWIEYRRITNQNDDPMLEKATSVHYYFYSIGPGALGLSTYQPLVPEQLSIFKRFHNVFSLAYKRFVDINLAEAQAREAEIQLALERVRARTMAMQKSEELKETSLLLFQQFSELGQTASQISIGIVKESEGVVELSATLHGNQLQETYSIPIKESFVLKKSVKAWKARKKSLIIELSGKELQDYNKWRNCLGGVKFSHTEASDDRWIIHIAYFSKGMLSFSSNVPHPKETMQLLERNAAVFDQTYTRFLDLKKAEAQTREAEIELALERVRARTMAMQHSDELPEAANLLFNEVRALGIPAWSAGYNLLADDNKTAECWMGTEGGIQPPFTLPFRKEKSFIEMFDFFESDNTFLVQELNEKQLISHYKYMKSVPSLQNTFKELERSGIPLPTHQINHLIKFEYGYLLFITYESVPESHYIFERFTRVFNQTYARFLDLQKAETQTREAQIEAALERVRSKAMAMQQSEDLSQSVTTTLDELEKLELQIQRCGVGIFTEHKTAQLWTTTHTDEGKQAIVLGELPLLTHPMMKGSYDAWLKKQGFSYTLEGDDLHAYYKMASEEGFALPTENIKKAKSIERQYYNYFSFPAGGLYVFSEEILSEKEGKIVQRFADVFHLAFTRYLDLQKSEARAVEAIKQASLDRVRAEIASMRTADDLRQITPLIWSELTTLGVPFIRCGVFIMDDRNSVMQSHLSTPDGKSLGVYDLPYGATDIAKKLVQKWKNKKAYKEHWNKGQFLKFMETMAKRGLIQNQERYQGDSKPPELLDLHFVPFKQGMLYAGNTQPLSEEDLLLVKSLAEAFSIAYARYEDFTLLEQAKNQTERAFSELKSTQSQLVHAEKMASLGELTAGIAHEIQNPLNFVNNFSEVSRELLLEMKEELDNGDVDEAKEIAGDIDQNLEKINHHGQRASDIVKGMLQHSRAGSGKKEPTNINKLADEYLRLAYHGLRAKDKSFNADFKTNLDESLPEINVVPQDIGRVLLNLINNAFYAVDKKVKEGIDGYKPEVELTTKRHSDSIQIRVKDNGPGIPTEIKDKIFQPFFTTKPTGSGTGLGLSLSYDIVKVHGGKLELECEINKGTEFIISIPS